VATELVLKDGQILAIGGLVKQKSEEAIRRVPFLSNIPLLGLFFRQKTTRIGGGRGSLEDTELFITLIPNILKEKPVEESKEEVLESQQIIKPLSPSQLEENIPEEKSLVSEERRPIDTYISLVKDKISEYAYYPLQAKKAGWEGVVVLNISILKNGRLKDIYVKESCGYKILDESAVNAVKKAEPFPYLPKELGLEELNIEIPVIYRHENKS
ncbi:MAG: TonB family protein, partial [Candidatus Omnitrophica bacterium]|nr:TonB family protein [Candidatus Omnitrophota bacterium]